MLHGVGKEITFFSPHFLPTAVLWISCSVKVYYLVTNTAVNSGKTDGNLFFWEFFLQILVLYHIFFIIYGNILLKQNSDFIIGMI